MLENKIKRNFRIGNKVNQFQILDVIKSLEIRIEEDPEYILTKIEKRKSKKQLFKICMGFNGSSHFFETPERCTEWARKLSGDIDGEIIFID